MVLGSEQVNGLVDQDDIFKLRFARATLSPGMQDYRLRVVRSDPCGEPCKVAGILFCDLRSKFSQELDYSSPVLSVLQDGIDLDPKFWCAPLGFGN